MIKKILSLVIFGVLTFGMLFATANEAQVNLKLTIPTIAPQYSISIDKDATDSGYITSTATKAEYTTSLSGDTLEVSINSGLYENNQDGTTITAYATVTQTNFARWKKDVELTIKATEFKLYDKAGKEVTGYTSSTPSLSYVKELHDDTLALTIKESTPSNSSIVVTLKYNELGFPVLANTKMFKIGITYGIGSIVEATNDNKNMMPVGTDGSYYKSTVTLTYEAV